MTILKDVLHAHLDVRHVQVPPYVLLALLMDLSFRTMFALLIVVMELLLQVNHVMIKIKYLEMDAQTLAKYKHFMYVVVNHQFVLITDQSFVVMEELVEVKFVMMVTLNKVMDAQILVKYKPDSLVQANHQFALVQTIIIQIKLEM